MVDLGSFPLTVSVTDVYYNMCYNISTVKFNESNDMSEKNKKILVAEDEKPLAKALQLKFEKAGIEVVTVFNGKDVFNELEKSDFDLILLDLMMPEMNGFAVLEEIKKKEIKIPVVITSNLSQEEDIKHSKELGAKEYIIKSNTPIIEIVDKVKQILSR